MSRKPIDITGQRFGKLVAVKRGSKQFEAYLWWYRCDCGAAVERRPSLVAKAAARGNSGPMCNLCVSANSFLVDKGVVSIDISTDKHTSVTAIIDENDADLVLDGVSRWHARLEPNGMLYASRKFQKQTMHRLIMGFPEGMEIDHINGNSLDNRRANLRAVTRRENARNTKRGKNNKTGVTGVFENKSGNFITYAMVKNKNTYLGTYQTLEEAAAIRLRAERENEYHKNHGRPSA